MFYFWKTFMKKLFCLKKIKIVGHSAPLIWHGFKILLIRERLQITRTVHVIQLFLSYFFFLKIYERDFSSSSQWQYVESFWWKKTVFGQ